MNNEKAIDKLNDLFSQSSDDSLLASIKYCLKYTLQLEPHQVKALCMIDRWATYLEKKQDPKAVVYRDLYKKFLNLKQYQQTDLFVMALIKHLAMHDFINKGLNLSVDKKI